MTTHTLLILCSTVLAVGQSAASAQAPDESKASTANAPRRRISAGSGTAETGIFNSVKATRAAFDQSGIKYTYVEYPHLAHEWQIWRKQLNDFAPLLFQW